MFDYPARQRQLHEAMERSGIDAYFCPVGSDLEYLTGVPRQQAGLGSLSFTHDWAAGALLVPGRPACILLPEFVARVHLPPSQTVDVVISESDDPSMVLADVGRRAGPVRRLAVAQRTWARTVIELTRAFANPQLVDGSALTEPIRAVKGADELAALGGACRIADEAMAAVTARLRPGVTTLELLHEVEYQLHVRGSSAVPFPTAVFAMGPDPSDEPYAVSNKPISSGMAVSFDFGAVCDGYCSDFGRTVFVGGPTEEARRVYEVVIAAQEAGIAAVHEAVPAADVDGAARAVIRDAGFAAMFHSRVGHSVGLDTHERPFIAPGDPTLLRPGMTFTVEPSVFWPGHTGVRIEDIVVCEPSGGRKLNLCSSEIVVV